MMPMPGSPRGAGGSETLQGTLIPNKIFIGGLAEKTNERDLRQIFEGIVTVKEVKIITDRSLISKSGEPRRYAFVELDSENEDSVVKDVKRTLDQFSKLEIELHGRRLNIGPAYKKVPTFGRVFGPGLAAPAFDATSMETLYLQQLIAQQQRIMAQSAYAFYGGPYAGMPTSPAAVGPYGGMNFNNSSMTYSQPSVGLPSQLPHDSRPQPGPYVPMSDSRYMAVPGNRQDQRGGSDSTLIRTSHGFTEVDTNLIRQQAQMQMQYHRH